ncbi:unnamed protein product [Schistosoma margrebowiei]|uniref:Lipase n=1 Tax=Schistosoma margrebowiei TaxID=48269 RepID=A0AA85ANC0_9TREM|nr:unnamed protein product [Schistosoma margrebowiei]
MSREPLLKTKGKNSCTKKKFNLSFHRNILVFLACFIAYNFEWQMKRNALLYWFLWFLIVNVFVDEAQINTISSVTKVLEAFESGVDPEVYQNITEVIFSKGYTSEEHYVTTEDGFILCIIRILPKCHVASGRQKVVFLQHGLLDSAHTWVNNLPDESLGFILADNCYDVWLGNSRGSTYSSNHQYLKPDDKEFWEFSWDEMGKYDLPATLMYILNYTNAEKLSYIGHSQGCQIILACFDEHPMMQSFINLFIALAPAAYLGSIKSPIRYIAPFAKTVEPVIEWFGNGEFLPSGKIMQFLALFLCKPNHIPFVCSNIMYLIAGYDSKNTNVGIVTDRFQRYDYGPTKNLQIYNQSYPPLYNISQLKIPIIIYYGGHDWLASYNDVYKLIKQINYTISSIHYFPQYNHLDFVWGLNAGKLLYPLILKQLSRV